MSVEKKVGNELVDIIRELIKDEIDKTDNTVLCTIEAEEEDGRYTVSVVGAPDNQGSLIHGVVNITDYQLEVGSQCYVYAIRNQLQNSFILGTIGAKPRREEASEGNSIIVQNISSGGAYVDNGAVKDVLVNGTSVVQDKIAYINIPTPQGIQYVTLSQSSGVLPEADRQTLLNNASAQIIFDDEYYILGLRDGSLRTYYTGSGAPGVNQTILVDLDTGEYEYAPDDTVKQHIENQTMHVSNADRTFWDNPQLNVSVHNDTEKLLFNERTKNSV